MAEFWRYQDRLAAGQLLTKRPRSDRDVGPPLGSAGYGYGDLRADERDARVLDYGFNYGKAGAAFGSGSLAGTEITGLGDGTLLGAGVTGGLRASTVGLSALEDPRFSAGGTGGLRAPTVGLSALEDPRFSGADSGPPKGSSAGLNGVTSDIPRERDLPPALLSMLSHPLASRSLFVEGLPIDCTRREASHIFRRFRGYKDVRVSQKGKGSKKSRVLLCFVDFEDSISAARALEALQGYRFDEDDKEAEPLRMQFSIRGPRTNPKKASLKKRHKKRRH